MEPENIDWDNIDSTFIEDNKYENFDAPKWVDLSASDEFLVDDETWFCTQDCKHPKTAEDFLRSTSTTTSNSKAKLLRFASFSEILPFRDRHRRENSAATEISSYMKCSDKSKIPSYSGKFDQGNENENPNFSAQSFNDGSNKLKKPLLKPSIEIPKQLNGSKEECHAKSQRRPKLRSTFSAQNLLGGREIMSHITGFCSELKRFAMKGSKKGGANNEKVVTVNGVLEEVKEKKIRVGRERAPLLVVKEGRTLA